MDSVSPSQYGTTATPSCYIHFLALIRNLSWFLLLLLLLLFVYLHNFISWAEFLILQQCNEKHCELTGLRVWFAAGLSLPLTRSFSLKYCTITFTGPDLTFASAYLLLLLFKKYSLSTFTFCRWIAQYTHFIHFFSSWCKFIWFSAIELKAPKSNWHNSQYNEPFRQFLKTENNDKGNATQGCSNISNHRPFSHGNYFDWKVYRNHSGFSGCKNYCRNFLY